MIKALLTNYATSCSILISKHISHSKQIPIRRLTLIIPFLPELIEKRMNPSIRNYLYDDDEGSYNEILISVLEDMLWEVNQFSALGFIVKTNTDTPTLRDNHFESDLKKLYEGSY
jgi:hypothetical protein